MDVQSGDHWTVAEHTWRLAAHEVSALAKRIDRAAFADTVELLSRCSGRVICSGTGTSGAAAKKIAHTLSCVERAAFFLAPADAVHGGLGAVQHGDVAVLISKGGNTAEILALLPALKEKSVPIVGVTEAADSTLAVECTLLLRIGVEREADDLNMLATTSTLAVIAVFDAIAIAIMKRNCFTREQFRTIHPGGAVGERLLKGDY